MCTRHVPCVPCVPCVPGMYQTCRVVHLVHTWYKCTMYQVCTMRCVSTSGLLPRTVSHQLEQLVPTGESSSSTATRRRYVPVQPGQVAGGEGAQVSGQPRPQEERPLLVHGGRHRGRQHGRPAAEGPRIRRARRVRGVGGW